MPGGGAAAGEEGVGSGGYWPHRRLGGCDGRETGGGVGVVK